VDVFSSARNIASSVQLDQAYVGVYLERSYMLSELNRYTISGNAPTRLGAFAIQLNYFGYTSYHEMEPSLGFAKKLGEVDLGIKLNYRMISIPIYGSKSSIIPEIGSVWHITGKLHSGLRIYNPLSYFASNGTEARFSYSYSSGIGYEISPIVFLGISINKEEDKEVEVNTAIQYQYAKMFFAAMGISSTNAHAHFNFGYQYHCLRINVNSAWDARLGMSAGLMLIYCLSAKEK